MKPVACRHPRVSFAVAGQMGSYVCDTCKVPLSAPSPVREDGKPGFGLKTRKVDGLYVHVPDDWTEEQARDHVRERKAAKARGELMVGEYVKVRGREGQVVALDGEARTASIAWRDGAPQANGVHWDAVTPLQ